MSEPDLAVVAVDLDDPSHQRSLVDLLDEYARGSTGGGEPLSEFARSRLVPALLDSRRTPAFWRSAAREQWGSSTPSSDFPRSPRARS